jgi:hypothetical protein
MTLLRYPRIRKLLTPFQRRITTMVKMENGLPETNTAEEAGSTHQPNLDQDKHDKWLASRTCEQISGLASRLGQLARTMDESGKLSPVTKR